MPAASPCPAAECLQQFLLGRGTAAEAESIERHLETCARCLATLQQLLNADGLVEALRSRAPVCEERGEEIVRPLIERLKTLLRAEAEPAGEAADPGPPGEGSDEPVLPTLSPLPDFGGGASSPQSVDRSGGEFGFLGAPEVPGELGWLGPYRLLEVLGRGGMGVVFRAYDPDLDREVALKSMRAEVAVRPEARQRFVREARAAAAIAHDHVIHINHVGEENGVPYLVMPLLRGETLAQRLKRCEHLPLREVLRIGREVAEGLAAAHEQGLIHRDIKPGNIWLEAHPPARAGGRGVPRVAAAA
jgi:hypothetical protein